MRGVNKVILIGNLGSDPDKRTANNGNSIVNISLATAERWKDKNSGEMREKTEWHRVVFFGRIADVVAEYAKKGSKLYVEGKLQTRKWQDQSGQDRYTTEVVVDIEGSMQLLDSASNRSSDGQGNASYQPQRAQQQVAPPPSATQSPQQTTPPPATSFDDDEIPF